ncbi:MAG: endonuclease/exonuclease/phosphatase family protein [Sphingobacterium sp.]
MKFTILFLTFAFICFNCEAQKQSETFKVMAWNILHGANDSENGKAHAVQIIREINPDVILMVETYGSGKEIADSLGYNFHLIAPEGTALNDKKVNLSIISRYPFGERIDTEFPFFLGGREIIIQNQKIRFFSNWFHYLPWENEPEKLGKTAEELLVWERSGAKYEMIQKVLPYLKKYTAQADSIPMILGGDLNTPSHLDWGKSTRKMHNNLVVPWYSTKVLADIGLLDTYRTLNPNPVTHPGITWHTKGENDDHRIDYIFYKSPKLKSIKSESYQVFFNGTIKLNGKEILYPSDHGFVVTTFKIK